MKAARNEMSGELEDVGRHGYNSRHVRWKLDVRSLLGFVSFGLRMMALRGVEAVPGCVLTRGGGARYPAVHRRSQTVSLLRCGQLDSGLHVTTDQCSQIR